MRLKNYDPIYSDTFFTPIKAGFSQKRKTLQNIISGGMHWDKTKTGRITTQAGIDPKRRAQTLSRGA